MKKIIEMIVLAASVMAGVYLTRFLGNPINYSDCIISESSAEELVINREETDSLLDSLIFNEETLFFDASDRTFYYSLIEEDAGAFSPDIKIKSENKDVSIAFLEKEITEDGIRNNQTISFLVYTNELYCKYSLKCTTLPLMNIECPEEISGEDVYMKVTLFDNSKVTAARVLSSDGNIHMRGGVSINYPKKGYRFSLRQESIGGNIRPNHVSLLGMRQDDDWLLYSAYNDQEKIRNVFSSNLWKYTCGADNSLGTDLGMEYRYLELFINGEYHGLYALGYPIDEKQAGTEAENDRVSVYKHGLGKGMGEKLQFTKSGDIICFESTDAGDNNYGDSRLLNYYYDLYLNADNNEKLHSGIDINNAVSFYLFINLTQGVDNVAMLKNYYIILQDTPECQKAFYAPWDLDLCWGNIYSFDRSVNNTVTYAIPEDYNCIIESGYISQLLSNGDDYLWEKIFEKYKQLRKTGWSEENINSLLDKYESDIYGSGAFIRDMERWPDGTYADPAEGLNHFREYAMGRLQESDLYYERLETLYHQTENIFIRRSAGYKNFLEYSFIIEINNRELLEDSEYTDFLEYIGIDVSLITEDIRFILANPSKGSYEYLSSLNEEDGSERKTCIGDISLNMNDGYYKIKLNGIYHYEISWPFHPEIKMVIINNETPASYPFNLTKGYDIRQAQINVSPAHLFDFLDALSVTNYRAVIEINNPDILKDSAYKELFEVLGIAKEDIHDTTDFIVWNGLNKTALVLDNFHVSGSIYEDGLCSFCVFWNEEGAYGAYLDTHECFVSSPENNKYIDIRIVLLEPKTYDVVNTMSYNCE